MVLGHEWNVLLCYQNVPCKAMNVGQWDVRVCYTPMSLLFKMTQLYVFKDA